MAEPADQLARAVLQTLTDLLCAHNLSYTYDNGTQALRDVSLRIAAAERIAIVGPSGCGKSTLMRVLGGLLPATSGELQTGQSRIGLMFQDAALLPWRNVRENVRLPTTLGPRPQPASDQTVDAVLALVGLLPFAAASPDQLSGGMAQRTALARALLQQPEALLLDEPFGALDALTREALTERVCDVLSARGTAAIIVTHSIREAVFFADRVLVMSSRPGTLVGEVEIALPKPRRWTLDADPTFGALNFAVRQKLQLASVSAL